MKYLQNLPPQLLPVADRNTVKEMINEWWQELEAEYADIVAKEAEAAAKKAEVVEKYAALVANGLDLSDIDTVISAQEIDLLKTATALAEKKAFLTKKVARVETLKNESLKRLSTQNT